MRPHRPDPISDVYGDNLARLLRTVVAIAVAIGVPTMVAIVVLRGDEDPALLWAYPPILGYLGVYAWVLMRRPQQAVAFSRVTLLLFEAAWLAWMFFRLRSATDVTAGWQSLFPTVFMGFVVFLIVACLVLSTRLALVHAAALVIAVVTVGLIGLLGLPGGSAYAVDLVRYGIFLVVVVLLLQVLAQAKARLAVAIVAAERAAEEAGEMRDMAYLDALTGLANRRRLMEELAHHARHVSVAKPVAVVYFDLDHFKEVNDAHGHAMGDTVLCLAARAAERVIRNGDLVARVGGEEFVIVAPGTDRDQGVQLAERLRRVLPREVEDVTGVSVTASFGVVLLEPGEPPLAVLDRVDALMYDAKGAGRDRVTPALG